ISPRTQETVAGEIIRWAVPAVAENDRDDVLTAPQLVSDIEHRIEDARRPDSHKLSIGTAKSRIMVIARGHRIEDAVASYLRTVQPKLVAAESSDIGTRPRNAARNRECAPQKGCLAAWVTLDPLGLPLVRPQQAHLEPRRR